MLDLKNFPIKKYKVTSVNEVTFFDITEKVNIFSSSNLPEANMQAFVVLP